MKKHVRIVSIFVLLITISWSCTKNDIPEEKSSLKFAIDQSATNLNKAIDEISSSEAFSILTMSEGTLKSATVTDSIYKVYISLDLIKGKYEYKPVIKPDRHGISLLRFFSRTEDNDNMIVKMPLQKVKSPMSLRRYSPADSSLINNFSITVSEYHNNYNSYWDYDYVNSAEISIDNSIAGKLYIKSNISPENGTDYTSKYSFTDSYTANYKYLSGDTTVSSFAIKSGDKVLYEEKLLTTRNDTVRFGREHQYILTIGDVQIIRNSASKTVQVAVNGVIQPDAVITIIDREEDPEASVCKRREVQITFEDGTTTTISSLIGNSITDIRTLFNSLHRVYFAAYVVDWIAYDIYYQRN